MISLTKIDSFVFLSKVILNKKVFVRSQIKNEDSK